MKRYYLIMAAIVVICGLFGAIKRWADFGFAEAGWPACSALWALMYLLKEEEDRCN